jgi:hypothetical protein
MTKLITVALVFGAGVLSSPALALATNPSEHPAQAEQALAPRSSDFEGRRWGDFEARRRWQVFPPN